MRKTIAVITAIFCLSLLSPAQTWDQVRGDTQNYVYAEGWGQTLEEADNQAMSLLARRISVTVRSEYRQTEGQIVSGNETSRYQSAENDTRTFSTVSLTNSVVEILENGRTKHVARWISLDEVERMRERRLSKVRGCVEDARRCEKTGRPGDALRYYYWAYALVRAYPEVSLSRFDTGDGILHQLSTWLPEQVVGILSELHASASISATGRASILVTFRGTPARGIQLHIFDGTRWTGPLSTSDGRLNTELSYNSRPQYLHIRYEVVCPQYCISDLELNSALQHMCEEPLSASYAVISVK